MSIGDTFYGVFAGLGDISAGGINTTGLIDPFFFSGTDAVPEPGSLWLVLTRRRRSRVVADWETPAWRCSSKLQPLVGILR